MSGSGSCRDDLDSWLDDLPTEHYDAPAAPEWGEWRVVDNGHGLVSILTGDNCQTVVSKTFEATDFESEDEFQAAISEQVIQFLRIVTEHNQHSTLIAQRERLREALKHIRTAATNVASYDRALADIRRIARDVLTTIEWERTEGR